jgi:hypothetical protein
MKLEEEEEEEEEEVQQVDRQTMEQISFELRCTKNCGY